MKLKTLKLEIYIYIQTRSITKRTYKGDAKLARIVIGGSNSVLATVIENVIVHDRQPQF